MKIADYKSMNPNYDELWESSIDFPRFNDFEIALTDYIKGKNIHEHRKKLCKLDFTIINKILDLKLNKPGPGPIKEKLFDIQ